MMRTIETWIDIAASAERVWAVLTAFDEYPGWNPFITSIAGIPREGETLRIHIRPPGQSAMIFRPTVLVATPGIELTWLGHLLLPGLFDGRHNFRIAEGAGVCRFHQSEKFSGVLLPIFGKNLLNATRQGFDAMNLALKQKAEMSAGPGHQIR